MNRKSDGLGGTEGKGASGRIDMNHTLLSQYVSGAKLPSEDPDGGSAPAGGRWPRNWLGFR